MTHQCVSEPEIDKTKLEKNYADSLRRLTLRYRSGAISEREYNRLLEWATEAHKVCDGMLKEDLEHLFPELKESEGEKIRKRIIQALHGDVLEMSEIKEAVDWLENQGKHSNFLSKIQVGDKVTRNEDGVLVNLSQLNRVAKKQTEQKLYVNDNAKEMFIKALERVEEQNNKGYKLTDCDKNSWWEDFKNYTSCTIEQKSTGWSEKLIADVFEKVGLAKIAREQSNDNLTNALQDAMIELSKFTPQPKQEWSEEDESRIDNLCHFLEEYGNQYYGCLTLQGTISWLKSLKPQNWKPSKEQMNTLEYYMHTLVCNEYKEILFGLYADLKKLMEE